LHLKRFDDSRNKYNGSVEFKEILNLLPYYIINHRYSSKELYKSLKYELIAVSEHLGSSINSGHYIAYAKRGGSVIIK